MFQDDNTSIFVMVIHCREKNLEYSSLKGDIAHIYCSTVLNRNENKMNLSLFFLLQRQGDTYLYLKKEVMLRRKKLEN